MTMTESEIPESRLNAYDRIAPVYDVLAGMVFGGSISKAQRWQIDFIPPGAAILVLGGGTGWLLEGILREGHPGPVTYLEASRAMIDLARKRRGTKKVQFIHGTMVDIPKDAVYDVIIANFFFDQFSPADLSTMLARLSRTLKPDGVLLVADFVDDAKWKKVFLAAMYKFFSAIGAVAVSALPPWRELVSRSRFEPVDGKRFYGGFIASMVYRKR
jgi:ubiquinone/menaquinone biosynthesis C-methylase UbiE